MDRRTGVLLLNMGGPESPEAIRPFLRNLFSDRDIIRLPGGRAGQWLLARLISRIRTMKVRGRYEAIGGGSPIAELTKQQAEALERRLNAGDERQWTARPAMRYWHPFTREALSEMHQRGVRDLIALTMYPHSTRATTGSSMGDLERLLADEFSGTFRLTSIDRWPTLEGYLDALTGRVREQIDACHGTPVVLFSAHGLPVSFIEDGDSYVEDIKATISGVMDRLPDGQPWRLAYQSRLGPGEWLSPTTDNVMRELVREGSDEVVVVPVSFVTDHLETLYDIGVQLASLADELGIRTFRVTRALNDDPQFIEALASLVRETTMEIGNNSE